MNPKLFEIENEGFKKELKQFFKTETTVDFIKAQKKLLSGLFLLPCKIENEKEKAYPLITNEKKEEAIPLYLDLNTLSKNLPINEFNKVEILNFVELISMLKFFPNISGIIIDFGSLDFYLKREIIFDLGMFLSEIELPSKKDFKSIENICDETNETINEIFLDNLISFAENHSYIKALWFYKNGIFWTMTIKHNLKNEDFFTEIQNIIPKVYGNVKIQNTRSALILKEIKNITPLYKKDS